MLFKLFFDELIESTVVKVGGVIVVVISRVAVVCKASLISGNFLEFSPLSSGGDEAFPIMEAELEN